MKLTVTDDDGASDTKTTTVTISDTNPVADFSSAVNGLTVDFTDASESYDGITSWKWEFGDGASSTTQNPSHTYASASDYDVSLTVTEDDGDFSTISQRVSVIEQQAGDNTMLVNSITLTEDSRTAGRNIFTWAIATVEVVGEDYVPLQNAEVSGHWSGDASDIELGLTGADGKIVFQSNSIKANGGTFTFNVDSVTLEGYTYDVENSMTSNTIVV